MSIKSGMWMLLVLLVSATPSHAAVTVFSDNFENDTLAANPNNPQVGSWVDFHNSGGLTTNAASPGPTQGSQYFDQPRSGVDRWSGAALTTPISNGQLTATMMLRTSVGSTPGGYVNSITFNSNTSNFTGGALSESSDGPAAVLNIYYRGNNLVSWNSGNTDHLLGGINYTVGAWQNVQVVIDFGAGASGGDTFTLTIGSTTVGPITFNGPTVAGSVQAPITRFYVSTWLDGSTYVDGLAITAPEPASLALLGIGGVALLRRRR